MSKEERKCLEDTIDYAYKNTDDYVNWTYVEMCKKALEKEDTARKNLKS